MRAKCLLSTAIVLNSLVGTVLAEPATASHPTSISGAPNVFGSVALPVKHSRYSTRWLRVAEGAHSPLLESLVRPAKELNRG